MRWFAATALTASAFACLAILSGATTTTSATQRAMTSARDCPVEGKVQGGGTAMGAAAAGWRHIIAADAIAEVQGGRYRRSRSNTPLVQVVLLGEVDIGIGRLPGTAPLKRMARKRCPRMRRAEIDTVWALVYHDTLSTVCCVHWFLFAWRSEDRWHVY